MTEDTKQEPPIIQVNVLDYRGKCPHCLKNIEAKYAYFDCGINPAEDSVYVKYKTMTDERFGAFSLPLCHKCWKHDCEKCEGCDMPMGNVAFSGAFGSVLMAKTTVAAGDWATHICDVCQAAGFTGAPCDCVRCKRQQEKLCTS